jgi:hypothetical protein
MFQLPPLPKVSKARSLFAALALIILGIAIWGSNWKLVYWAFGILALAAVGGLPLRASAWVWVLLGEVLGWVNSRILLTLLFYLVLTPIAILYRTFGKKDWFRFRTKAESYFVVREKIFNADDLQKPW